VLVSAIERAADLDPLIAQMRERQQQRESLLKAIVSTQTLEQIHFDRDAIQAEVQEHVAKWRETLVTAAVEGGRRSVARSNDWAVDVDPDRERLLVPRTRCTQ
jgi:hypothetical protein